MAEGVPIGRHSIVMLRSGEAAIDWGEGTCQVILSGEFIRCEESEISHTITDEEMEVLKHSGYVAAYDKQRAFVLGLPDRPTRTIE